MLTGKPDVKLKRLVLLGGGHSHLTVLKKFYMKPLPGLQLTLVTKDLMTPYSGMIPGYVAGHYSFRECHIDLVKLCTFANADLIHAAARHIDVDKKQLHFDARPPVAYDCLSVDIGITPKAGVPGFEFVTPVKPIDGFVRRLDDLLERVQQRKQREAGASAQVRVVVVGGGAGGVEVAFAVHHRLSQLLHSRQHSENGSNTASGCDATANGSSADAEGGLHVALVSRRHILPSHPARARRLCLAAAERKGLRVHEGTDVVSVSERSLRTASGEEIAFDECLWCTQASAPAWLDSTALPKEKQGFLAINDCLQSADGPPEVFACGDVATSVAHPRPKAGVFAVRQGAPLAGNLRRFVTGQPLKPFVPQSAWMGLISTGGKHAVLTRGWLAFSGDWLWAWKDRIDRTFMRKFGTDLPPMNDAQDAEPEVLHDAGAGAAAAWAAAGMRCRGCAAKVDGRTLDQVLSALTRSMESDATASSRDPGTAHLSVPAQLTHDRTSAEQHTSGEDSLRLHLVRDDAALIAAPPPGHVLLQTVDFLSACVSDAYLFGRIAAVHALSDCFAMGAQPSHALAIAQVPHAAPAVQRETLELAMRGALRELRAAGCRLDGGHTCTGADLALGFTVTGHAAPARLMRKDGLQPGHALVLTKALGTGLVLRGGMLMRARGEWLEGVWTSMTQSNGDAAQVLQEAAVRACTDVTGFGLLGHALEMATASQVDVSVRSGSVPLLAGAAALAGDGIRSTAHAGNMQLLDGHCTTSCSEANTVTLVDPQTSGGLLCGVNADEADALVSRLHAAGYSCATVIGDVRAMSTDTPTLHVT